jgi:S1-C subfamily serine protease
MRSRLLTISLTAVLAASVGFGAAVAIGGAPDRTHAAAGVAEDALGSVVALEVEVDGRSAAATGFAVGSGTFVTAAHAVPPSSRVWAVLPDGRRAEATGVRRDGAADVAVLSFDGAGDVRPLRWAQGAPAVGSGIVVLANLLGAGGVPSVSTGIVAATDRTISGERPLERLLQLDVTAGPGSSGAPVLDRRGRVVGMVVAVPDAVPGMALAVPASSLRAALAA